MSEENLRRALRGLNDDSPPGFEQVTATRSQRRVRRLGVGAAILVIAAAGAAPFVLRPPSPEPEISLPAPPTTDWLLQTPNPAWVADLDHAEEESSHVR